MRVGHGEMSRGRARSVSAVPEIVPKRSRQPVIFSHRSAKSLTSSALTLVP